MTLPNANSVSAARRAASGWATRHTAFIHDEWYVAGFAAEFRTDALLARTLLGRTSSHSFWSPRARHSRTSSSSMRRACPRRCELGLTVMLSRCISSTPGIATT